MAELIRAIRSEDETEIWKQLARSDVTLLVNVQSKNKLETPLFWASMKGDITVVRSLLEKGAKLDLKTNWGATPLHAASEMGHLEIVKLLVESGASPNHQTHFGDTPAHLAAYRGHFDVVKYLVEAGSDIFLKNSKRRTVLDEASAVENAKIVRYLDRIVFGEDMKPTIWKTPYSGDDPMVTTNLMQPVNSRTNSSVKSSANSNANSSSYPTSPQRKQTVSRSRSSPFTDHPEYERAFLDEVRVKLGNLNSGEVVHHPTVRLRPSATSDDVLRYPFGREFSKRRASANIDKRVMGRDNHSMTSSSSRPRSDIASGNSRSNALAPSIVHCENTRTRSLEKMVSELQCGLSYTQDELERTKANLKVAKEQIDILYATQRKSPEDNNNRDARNNERRRFILNIADK